MSTDSQTYTITINEYQRKLLLFMTQYTVAVGSDNLKIKEGEWEGNALAEALVLEEMLKNLPKDEANQPGVIHGFCL